MNQAQNDSQPEEDFRTSKTPLMKVHLRRACHTRWSLCPFVGIDFYNTSLIAVPVAVTLDYALSIAMKAKGPSSTAVSSCLRANSSPQVVVRQVAHTATSFNHVTWDFSTHLPFSTFGSSFPHLIRSSSGGKKNRVPLLLLSWRLRLIRIAFGLRFSFAAYQCLSPLGLLRKSPPLFSSFLGCQWITLWAFSPAILKHVCLSSACTLHDRLDSQFIPQIAFLGRQFWCG